MPVMAATVAVMDLLVIAAAVMAAEDVKTTHQYIAKGMALTVSSLF
jgi:hypothetical protein